MKCPKRQFENLQGAKFCNYRGSKHEEVIFIWKTLFYLYEYGAAALGFIYCLLVHFTSKILIIGRENLQHRD